MLLNQTFRTHISCLTLIGLLSACAGADVSYDPPPLSAKEKRKWGFGKVMGEDVFVFGGRGKKESAAPGIGVNTYLWRAALDVIAFMPVAQTDPFGGAILTDWYTPPSTPDFRIKVNILILDAQMRSDALRVSVFTQSKGKDGGWHDDAIDMATQKELEDAILTRARQLRINSLNS